MVESLSPRLENKLAPAPSQPPFLAASRSLTFLAFIRESSPQQTRREKYGPRQQWRDIHNFALSWPGGPHKVPAELAITVVEQATKWERPEWAAAIQRGIALFKAGLGDGFVFGRVDRESRNPFSSAPILRRAIDAGVQIYFAQEGFHLNPRDPDSVNQYQQEVAKASDYIAKFVKLARGGRLARAQDDQKLPSNSKMFGFDVNDGKRVPNISQASALNQAADIAIHEGSPGPAARWLNEKGWKTTMGKPFTTTTLADKDGLFRNTALIGETVIHFREGPVTIYHQGIMDKGKFETLNRVLDTYQGQLRVRRQANFFYALSGIFFCRCGARYESFVSNRKPYYRCAAGCGMLSTHRDRAEWSLYNGLGDWFRNRQERGRSLELSQRSAEGLRLDLLRVKHEKEKLEGQWKALLKKDLSGYPRDTVQDEMGELRARNEAIEKEERRLKEELAAIPAVTSEDLEQTLEFWGRPWEAEVPSTSNGGTLTQEQARELRAYLIRFAARLTKDCKAIRITGNLPVVVAKQDSSEGVLTHLRYH